MAGTWVQALLGQEALPLGYVALSWPHLPSGLDFPLRAVGKTKWMTHGKEFDNRICSGCR